jgi:predicted transcriptional regulator
VPKDRKFVNPLTQSTETLPATETSTLPSTSPVTYTSTLPQVKHRKRGNQAFEKTHERITLWLDSDLKQRFESLADEQGVAKSTLLDEAISDLLAKYDHPEVTVTSAQIATMEDEIQHLQARLDIEEMYRTDTRSHHFKKWIRSHDHPQDTDFFFKRFLADGQLPEHASRGLYEAKMRTAGYSEEDMHLFQDTWKAMLFASEWK